MIVGLLDDDLMVRNNIGDVAHCERSLQTLNEDSGDQLYRYLLYLYSNPPLAYFSRLSCSHVTFYPS
jgi:hypothetical protein